MRGRFICACFFTLLLVSCTPGTEKASDSVKAFASGGCVVIKVYGAAFFF